jgi:hypothetical protein
MVLVLHRTYFPKGTQGIIEWNGTIVCYTIELPWLQNQRQISCVPEGEYQLRKRFSKKYGWHIQLQNVTNRDLILFHPANDALKELKGCIAPVTFITGIGKGSMSRKALKKLIEIVFKALQNKEEVRIVIQKGIPPFNLEGY